MEFTSRQHSGPSRAFVLIPVAILVLATLNLHVAYVRMAPGPARNIVDLVRVDGVATTELNGELLMTTVSLRDASSLAEVIGWWLQPSVEVLPRTALLPDDRTDDEERRMQAQLMQQSQLFAAAAALELLGYEVQVTGAGVQVVRLEPDVPAADVLRLGDVIVAADGQPITEGEELIRQVDRRGVGDEVRLSIVRDGEEIEVGVRTVARTENANRPMIGVGIQTLLGDVHLPVNITIDAGPIGGPSAGLMFALAVVDLLDADDLIAGRRIAGTGMMSLSGEVGSVGGVRQKVIAARRAGAELFLSPRRILDSACSAAKDLPIVAVDELADAVEALRHPETVGEGSCR